MDVSRTIPEAPSKPTRSCSLPTVTTYPGRPDGTLDVTSSMYPPENPNLIMLYYVIIFSVNLPIVSGSVSLIALLCMITNMCTGQKIQDVLIFWKMLQFSPSFDFRSVFPPFPYVHGLKLHFPMKNTAVPHFSPIFKWQNGVKWPDPP